MREAVRHPKGTHKRSLFARKACMSLVARMLIVQGQIPPEFPMRDLASAVINRDCRVSYGYSASISSLKRLMREA